MLIVIAGMGDVGFHLAKQLSKETHDIVAIDADSEKLAYADSLTDILTINGYATSVQTLRNAKIDKADLLVAVTSSEEVNITTAILAKKLGAKKCIARIGNAEYLNADSGINFYQLGVDYMIYPEEMAAQEIVSLIHRTAATDVLEFEKGKLSILGLRLDKSAPIIQKRIVEVAQEYSSSDFRVVAIHRNLRTIIPTGNDRFLPNDQIFVITNPKGSETALKLAGKENIKFENVMILGGGKIGKRVAALLENSMNVKLIEADEQKSIDLADELEKTLVLRGDGRDIDLLAQEGIIDMDAFIAVTEDAETNIISSLMAKHLGVKKTITLVDRADYIPLTQTIGLDSLINKKLIAAYNISRFIHKGEIVTIATLEGIDAEVFEYTVKPGSLIAKHKIKESNFPKEAIIGGVIRGDEGFVAVGDTQIINGDKVVVFALPGALKKIEKFF